MNPCWLCQHENRPRSPYLHGGSIIYLCEDRKACNQSFSAKQVIVELIRKKQKPLGLEGPPDQRTLSAGD